MGKYLYNKFWYPIIGKVLSKFVFIIEGKNLQEKDKDKFQNRNSELSK